MYRKARIPDETWERVKVDYELGKVSGSGIARSLGVSPQTVARRMKGMGARKASRVHETTRDLNRALDQKEAQRREMELYDLQIRNEIAAHNLSVLDQLFHAIMEADTVGDVTLASSAIEEARRKFNETR